MQAEEYLREVERLVLAIRASAMDSDIVIRPIMPRGIEGTLIRSCSVWTSNRAYRLEVGLESFLFNQHGPYDCAFRYRFYVNEEQIMRIQTDKHGFPANARFPSQPSLHFQEQQWLTKYRRPNFLKMYSLFREIITAKGDLPENFRSAAAGLIS